MLGWGDALHELFQTDILDIDLDPIRIYADWLYGFE
jgi:hypothetical protein